MYETQYTQLSNRNMKGNNFLETSSTRSQTVTMFNDFINFEHFRRVRIPSSPVQNLSVNDADISSSSLSSNDAFFATLRDIARRRKRHWKWNLGVKFFMVSSRIMPTSFSTSCPFTMTVSIVSHWASSTVMDGMIAMPSAVDINGKNVSSSSSSSSCNLQNNQFKYCCNV